MTVLDRPASFSVEPSQTLFDQLKSTFPGKNVLRDPKNRNLWSPTVSHGVERLENEDKAAGTAGAFSIKELWLEYIESDSVRVCSSKRRAGLDVWLE